MKLDIECRKKPFLVIGAALPGYRETVFFVCLKDGKIDSCSLRRKTEKEGTPPDLTSFGTPSMILDEICSGANIHRYIANSEIFAGLSIPAPYEDEQRSENRDKANEQSEGNVDVNGFLSSLSPTCMNSMS